MVQENKIVPMKNQQSNKLKMAQTTLGCGQHETNAPLWAGIVGIEETVELLEETIAATRSARFVNMDRDTPMLLPCDLRQGVPEGHIIYFIMDAVEQITDD